MYFEAINKRISSILHDIQYLSKFIQHTAYYKAALTVHPFPAGTRNCPSKRRGGRSGSPCACGIWFTSFPTTLVGRLPNQYMNAGQSAIVFGADMKQMPILMGIGGDQRHKHLAVEEGFRRFYYLTNDRFGEIVLQLLCEPDKKALLDGILAEGLSGPQQYGLMENDAMDGEEPMLFGYTCDMPRMVCMTFAPAPQVFSARY